MASCALKRKGLISHEVGFSDSIREILVNLYVNREERIKESVMKFMKLGSRPDTFYTAEAVR